VFAVYYIYAVNNLVSKDQLTNTEINNYIQKLSTNKTSIYSYKNDKNEMFLAAVGNKKPKHNKDKKKSKMSESLEKT
jgi:hypothetical protein